MKINPWHLFVQFIVNALVQVKKSLTDLKGSLRNWKGDPYTRNWIRVFYSTRVGRDGYFHVCELYDTVMLYNQC